MRPEFRALRLLQLLCWPLDFSTGSSQTGNGCGHSVLTTYGGTLSSKNFPGTYPNTSSCEWQIHGATGSPLSLAFGDMDIEASRQCKSGFLLFSSLADGSSFGPYCSNATPPHPVLVLNSTSVTVLFNSTMHRSGRGFLLSYASGNRSDLISCLQKGIHYNTEQIRAYCPAGCKGVTGDIWGNLNQGYRDTSVLCKAAVHAGVILDEQGGPIVVLRGKGITLYESSFANGLSSKRGSLSEKRLIFHKECTSPLEADSFSASSSWHEQNIQGESKAWAAERAAFSTDGSSWAAAGHSSANEWLEIDLGGRRNITGIITKGSSHKYNFYVKSYQVQFSRDGKNWKIYKSSSNSEEKIFEGNSDSYQEASNAIIPPIVARYLRIVPQTWNQRAALKVGLLGCEPLRGKHSDIEGHGGPKRLPGLTSTPSVFTTIPAIVIDPEKTGFPLLLLLLGGSLLIAITVLLLVFLCCKRRKTPAQNDCSFGKGYLTPEASQVCSRANLQLYASEISTFPRPAVSDHLTGAQAPEYAEPDVVQASPSCQPAPSTFNPAADDGYTLPLVANPYNVPSKHHEYTEPLPLEPEYATPFVEQPLELKGGACRKNTCVKVLPSSKSLAGSLTSAGGPQTSMQYDFPTQWLVEKLDSHSGEIGQQEKSIRTDAACLPSLSPGDRMHSTPLQGHGFQHRNCPSQHVYHKPL